MRFGHVFFDFDGTLMKTDPGITAAMRYATGKLGVAMPGDMGAYIGPPLYDVGRELGLSEEDAEKLVAYYREHYNSEGMLLCEPYPGVFELVDDLRRAGTKVYVATSKPEPTVLKIMRRFGLEDRFDGVTGASFDNSRSHKVDVLRHAIESRGINLAAAAMVGDKDCDMEAAKTLGCAAIGVLYGYGTRGELEDCGADALAQDADALRRLLLG